MKPILSKKGVETLLKAGGLHKFMNWDGALLTVSDDRLKHHFK